MQQVDPFPASDFDQWAGTYDGDVVAYDQFPFAGYERILRTIVTLAEPRPGMSVLDIGIGTGNLARLFHEAGCKVWGADYSAAMLAKAQQKLPEATLVLHDLRAAWPARLDRRFDRIVSAYTFHHFELDRKVAILAEMASDRLGESGRIVIADISFRSEQAMRTFAASLGDEWEEEPYWLADLAQAALEQAGFRCNYEQVSPCGGVYTLERA